MTKINDPFLDINGLVLPNPKSEEKPSDNGVYFTSISVLLGFEVPNYKELVRECYLEPGLIARWKGNNFDNCAWDDYLGVAAACIYIKDTSIPKEILQYGIKHFFVYNTDGKLGVNDFLLRNVPIWPIMLLAAFPKLKYLFYPFAWGVAKFFDHPADLMGRKDSSGFQLQWTYLRACKLMGFNFDTNNDHEYWKPEAFRLYYSADHPFNQVI